MVDAIDKTSKMAVKLVRSVNFRLEISPRALMELWMREVEERIPVE